MEKISFRGALGDALDARLDAPSGPPRATALFAHCFTCGKDIAAAARIAAALAERGFAVLRFDFTGLGHSGGEFANTSFSSNVQDLVAAAAWLRENREAPSLLVGHSLGGAAVLAAAGEIPEAKAVVSIAAPSDPRHVKSLFAADIEEIEREGEAEVELAGRPFRIRKQFLDDTEEHRLHERIRNMDRALLVMHSVFDEVVGIDHAERIFGAAKHPKSFVSLDTANHLITKKPDAEYVASVIAAWASRYFG